MKKNKSTQEFFEEGKLNGKKNSVLSKVFFGIFISYIILFVIFMASYIAFKARFTCIPVTGRSMQPTINASVIKGDPNNPDEVADWVYIEKRDYKYEDIVVFDAKKYQNEELCLIKRLLAFGGDAVTIIKMDTLEYNEPVYKICRAKAQTIADGSVDPEDIEVLDEKYTTDPYDWTYNSIYATNEPLYDFHFKQTFFSSGKYEVIMDTTGIMYAIIPENEFFYMADNRSEGSDSRSRGTEKMSAIRGAVEIHVKDAESSSSALWVQIREVCKYYFEIIGDFFSNLWVDLEKSFDI